jgi:hypothetical protein
MAIAVSLPKVPGPYLDSGLLPGDFYAYDSARVIGMTRRPPAHGEHVAADPSKPEGGSSRPPDATAAQI